MTQPDNDAPDDNAATTEAESEKLVLSSPDQSATPKDFLLWSGVLVLAVLVVFSPALRGKFIWDDDRHVVNNPGLRSADGLEKIWFDPIAVLEPQYYPLTHSTYWLEYQAAAEPSGEINPLIFHLDNMLFHAAGAILLWFILRKLGIPAAWVAATIWAIHPMQTESVAWISERKMFCRECSSSPRSWLISKAS